MPIITTSEPGLTPPSRRLESHNWPTISAVLRLRLKPCLPVEQNAQSSTQPAWLEMHSVPRLVSGMNTASTAFASSTLRSHLRSEEHTSELQSHSDLVCRLLLEKKKIAIMTAHYLIYYELFYLNKPPVVCGDMTRIPLVGTLCPTPHHGVF